MRYLPNLISLGRGLSAGWALWLVGVGNAQAFLWLICIAGCSDFVDGWLARRFGWTSRLGAVLDSTADILMILVTLVAIHEFHPLVFRDHGLILWAIVSIWTLVHLGALVRYGRTASFHTQLARTGILLFAAFVIVLFSHGFVGWLYYLCGVTCLSAGIENLVMVSLFREWRPDSHGGLMELIRSRRTRG